eukprot:TRINITY_DN4096_c0_g1_i2.p1 TRINITY_DN4096_c0_g1~~TRINITY_DN4096_c0_g1_i2.p1  ORF type:complete len:513 (+),score=187.69 TRINITY_DN4096_c0_g1_i2:107-1645(+)
MTIDTVHILVAEAKNLAVMDMSGTSDPYVVLTSSFNKQTFKTKIIKRSLTPKWGEEFSFFTKKPEGTLELKMYDYDVLSPDEFMGVVRIPISRYADGREYQVWFKLDQEPLDRKKKDSGPGELLVKIWCTGPAQQQALSPPASRPVSALATPPPAAPSPTPAAKAPRAPPIPIVEPPKSPRGPETSRSSVEAPKSPRGLEVSSSDSGRPKSPRGSGRIEDKYIMGKELGRGAFSIVKLGTSKATGKTHAIKCIIKKNLKPTEMQLLEREIDIMDKLKHPNVIELSEIMDSPDFLYLVLELCSGGELFDAIVKRGSYSEADAAHVVKQILQGVKYCHDNGVAHRDLKPENLLLASTPGQKDVVKLADFGLSKDVESGVLSTSCGTPDYVAPEVLLNDHYDVGVDIWSIGVITYVLLCGFPPFYGERQKDLFENIMAGRYNFPEPEWSANSEEAKDFIRHMLVTDPKKRYTAQQCLDHKWIQMYNSTDSRRPVARGESFSVSKFRAYTEQYKKK